MISFGVSLTKTNIIWTSQWHVDSLYKAEPEFFLATVSDVDTTIFMLGNLSNILKPRNRIFRQESLVWDLKRTHVSFAWHHKFIFFLSEMQ